MLPGDDSHDDMLPGDDSHDDIDDMLPGDDSHVASPAKRLRPNLVDGLSDDDVPSDAASMLSDASVQSPCKLVGVEDMAVDCLPRLTKRSRNILERNRLELETLKAEQADRLGLHGEDRKYFFHICRSRNNRAKSKVEQEITTLRSELSATAGAWNKCKLRLGDQMDDKHRERTQSSQRWTHPSAWSVGGTIEYAFSRIGALSPNAPALAESRRALDAIAVVALAAHDFQKEAVKTWSKFTIPADDNPPMWVVATRCHDAQAVKVGFGAISELRHIARYWHKQASSSSSSLLSYSEFCEKQSISCPSTA